MITYPRVSGRLNNIVDLNMSFYRNGVLTTPFAVRKIEIYRGFVRAGQKVAEILFPDPSTSTYPSPGQEVAVGEFSVPFIVPEDFVTCETYIDVWHYLGQDPGSAGIDEESLWLTDSGRFWVFEDVWITDDDLTTKRIGFEPLDKKFRRGEIRNLEVAIHPLPKYEYNFNQLAPIIPQLEPTISILTAHDELIVRDAECKIGVRQGSHKNSPFVVQCGIDTRTFLRGMYKYTIKVNIGNNILISPEFYFTIQ